ncbi:MAG: DNA topoisomerase (ATP-hydrolyzing) subunit B [Candidatus Brocadiia bacterium]
MSEPAHAQEEYGADSIKVLDGIEHVRKRPAMYIGDTSERGLHQLAEEVVANAVDEAMAGRCDRIHVRLHPDGSISVTDNGSGIPVDKHSATGKSALEVVMTTLNAGGKFDHNAYKVSAGLHGVGVSCVNALSAWLEAEVHWRDGHVYYQRYEKGVPQTPVENRGKTNRRGTRIRFKPDPEVFEVTAWRWDLLVRRLRELAFLNSGVRIAISSDEGEKEEVFFYEGGIREFVQHLNQGKDPLHDDVVYVQRELEAVICEIAFQYNGGYTESIYSFANNINTVEGGTHLSGLRAALTRTFNAYGREHGLLKKVTPSGQDYREGLTAVVSVKLPDPQFEGQTKTRLGNREVGGLVEQVLNEKLANYCEENPDTTRAIVNKAMEAARAREAARKARELTRRKGALTNTALPGKLRDCSSQETESTELFIVEGQSAGGTASMGRDRKFQAILPLRGVILNVEKARIDKMLRNKEIRALITALGTGIGQEEFDASNVRYGKIIIMTDADIDGAHIRTLLLTFFFRQMTQLIRDGRVYIAQPPLYRVRRKGREEYIHDDRALQRALLRLGTQDAELHCRCNGQEEVLEEEQFLELVRLVAELDRLGSRVEAQGIGFRRYLELRREGDGAQFPRYRVIHVDGENTEDEHLFYTEKEYDRWLQELRQALEAGGQELQMIEEDELGVPEPEDLRNSVRPRRFGEAARVEALVQSIEQMGVPIAFLFAASEPELEPFTVQSNGTRRDCRSLMELVPVVGELGRQGLDIQRYKGLGEMNASELADTTLKPQTRRLVRVTIGDAVQADQYFSILAGKDVQSRREFIERHALEVKNLDL